MYIYQNNASNVHSCIHGVYRYILYAFEYLTFRIYGSHSLDGKSSLRLYETKLYPNGNVSMLG